MDTFKKILPTNLGLFGILLIVIMSIQLFFIHFSGHHYFRFIPRDLWRIFHSYLAIYFGLLLVEYPTKKKKWFSFSIQSIYVIIQCAFIGYFVKTKQSFEYAILTDNFKEIFYSESLFVILNRVEPIPIYIGMIGIGGIFLKTLKTLPSRKPISFSINKYFSLFSFYLVLIFMPVIQFDELTNFHRSILSYYRSHPQTGFQDEIATDSYPFMKNYDKKEKILEEKPNVFLIMVESFNAGIINQKDKDGRPYTPFFNSMIGKGVYIDRFYGTSVQTVKGHFSSLFSLLPFIKGKVYKENEHNHFKSLPECLKDDGYATFFFNGHNSTGFDNTRSMMLNHGFDTYLVGTELLDESVTESWGSWGLNDDELYRRVFNYIDTFDLKESPAFITITPSHHHIPFSVPKEKRELYQTPISLKSRYANSIRLADNAFKVFFQELKNRPEFKNSIVIITADHSFPIGDHGIYFNEVGYYEESFRIPCLILWDGHLTPKIDTTHIFSQLDIAPTILENVNAMPKFHHFQGQNMLATKIEKKIYFIQPYNGTILGVLDFPYKYLKRIRTGEEWVFNLEKDPGEENNVIQSLINETLLRELRSSIDYIYLNQYLIENNQLIPAAE